ncbi:MAG: hypothetical protein RL033_2687 [Pseudomonadota bacterium]
MTKESEWGARVSAWRASGVSAKEFCKEQEYSATTLYWWSSRLRRSAESEEQAKPSQPNPQVRKVTERRPRAVQLARVVRAVTTTATASSTPVVVQLGRIRVEVTSGVDRAVLSAVLETLASIGGAR